MSAVKGGIHFFDKIRIYTIICIKYKVAVIYIFTGGRKTFEQIVKGITFAHLLMVVTAVHPCSCLCSNLRGIICAVICDHINVKKVRWIILSL